MIRGWLITGFIAFGLVLQTPETASAQQAGSALPAGVAAQVTQVLNDSATDVRSGDLVLEAGTRHEGDLAVIDGDLTLSGSIAGDLVVVNGDLRFLDGAEVSGSVMVVGGVITNISRASVGGEIASYRGSYEYERAAGEYRELSAPLAVARASRQGRSDFLITTGRSYNRVEGLPIAFGPRLQTEGSNPLRLEALGIYRTETGMSLEPDEMGYYVRADQFIGGHREFRVGAALYSVVDPIEDWHITDLETGLATFLFHRDYRDHFEREGWNVNAGWQLATVPLLLDLEVNWERHSLRRVGSPWSLFRNAEPWRPQPVVGAGRLGSAVVGATYDSRSSLLNPADGWLIRARLENGFKVDLNRREVAPLDPESAIAIPTANYGRFLHGLVDLRSYNRVDADSRLNVRVVAGGSITGVPLPPQRQHALGGEGSLPGYPLFSRDCGARSSRVTFASSAGVPSPVPYFANYGCDAFGLIQAEFRGKLAFRFRWDGGPWRDDPDDDDPGLELDWEMSPDWAIFVDAGRGWTFQDDRPNEDTHVDVGVGLLLDRFGIYLAVPVTSGSGVNLFVRLGPRF